MLIICDTRHECGNDSCVWQAPNSNDDEMLNVHCGTTHKKVNVQSLKKDALASMEEDNPNKLFARKKYGF